MKTVCDIYSDALTMKREGLSTLAITSRLVDIGHDSGFALINERGGPRAIELIFAATAEVIRFDGTDWHYVGQ